VDVAAGVGYASWRSSLMKSYKLVSWKDNVGCDDWEGAEVLRRNEEEELKTELKSFSTSGSRFSSITSSG